LIWDHCFAFIIASNKPGFVPPPGLRTKLVDAAHLISILIRDAIVFISRVDGLCPLIHKNQPCFVYCAEPFRVQIAPPKISTLRARSGGARQSAKNKFPCQAYDCDAPLCEQNLAAACAQQSVDGITAFADRFSGQKRVLMSLRIALRIMNNFADCPVKHQPFVFAS
jgi:hypothetical protein